jgi:hypothetical protein
VVWYFRWHVLKFRGKNMAQTNFTPIQLYHSTTVAAAPTAGNLASGELAINITDGKLFYKDNLGAVQVLATKAGASGDVVGPASSTDNALVRFDATTGKLVQNSVGILSDAGILTGLTGLTSSGSVTFSALTATRLLYASTGGLLVDSANLTFNGTDLTVSGAVNAGSVNATTLDLTNLEVTNIKAKDGTASITLADSTGVATINAAPVMTALTASQAVFTTAGKALVSNPITGTGNVVMSTSPTLVTPALGTPSSVTLTNATGLPVATGISGLGAGVATFLATPSSANLAAAVTDETGTGALVFANSPTLVTPALGTPASGVVTNLTGTASININGTVGATTPNTGNFTVLTENGSPAVVQTDIGTAPNEIPLNQYLGEMAYMNAEAVVIQPQASVTPNGIGDMVFQLTNDTTLVVKVKGSDGTVRSVTLTLA